MSELTVICPKWQKSVKFLSILCSLSHLDSDMFLSIWTLFSCCDCTRMSLATTYNNLKASSCYLLSCKSDEVSTCMRNPVIAHSRAIRDYAYYRTERWPCREGCLLWCCIRHLCVQWRQDMLAISEMVGNDKLSGLWQGVSCSWT